ncbi:MAG: YbgA family protein [Campylobacterota bacterium]
MKLGVSACLLGSLCRYDGTSSKNGFILNTLGEYFEFESYCPEAEVFGTPRPTIRLVNKDGQTRVLTTKDKEDLTDILDKSCQKNSNRIKNDDLCGFILKSSSPTCGMERVKVYQETNAPSEKKGVGRFAALIKKSYPHLPIEEEGRLKDAWLRENFLMQIFAYRNLHEFINQKPSFKDLVNFHTEYKYLIYSKSTDAYKQLGNIVANHEKKDINEVLQEYKVAFLEAINEKGSIKKTYNVLLHIIGYFKKLITKEEKKEILDSIEEYKQKVIPLIAVIKVIKLYAKRFQIDYLLSQKFLNPYPKELALRSDVKAYK